MEHGDAVAVDMVVERALLPFDAIGVAGTQMSLKHGDEPSFGVGEDRRIVSRIVDGSGRHSCTQTYSRNQTSHPGLKTKEETFHMMQF